MLRTDVIEENLELALVFIIVCKYVEVIQTIGSNKRCPSFHKNAERSAVLQT